MTSADRIEIVRWLRTFMCTVDGQLHHKHCELVRCRQARPFVPDNGPCSCDEIERMAKSALDQLGEPK